VNNLNIPTQIRPYRRLRGAGPGSDLLKLQQRLIDPVVPFTAETGTAAAFVNTSENPDINQPTIDYVAAFVPKETGKNFNPHVTVGIAFQDYLNKMLAEPFDVFTFSPAGLPFTNSATTERLGKNSTRGIQALRRATSGVYLWRQQPSYPSG